MSHSYAEKWMPKILEIVTARSYTSPFMVPASDIGFYNAKTFHFTTIAMSGYKEHSRDGSWNKGTITSADVTFTLQHDRDIEFFVDKRDVDETNLALAMQNLTARFTATQQVPEQDALFFERVTKAATTASLSSETDIATVTPENVLEYLKKLTRRGNIGLYKPLTKFVIYVRPEIMDALELCKEFNRIIDVTKIGGNGLDTRITSWNNFTIVEVEDLSRFYSEYDYADGFKPKSSTAKQLNAVVCSPYTVKTINKIATILVFEPGEHTQGDGFLYQDRRHFDTIILPNGDGKVDSIAVDMHNEAHGVSAVSEPSVQRATPQVPTGVVMPK